MYLAIDIGGSKTLICRFNKDGSLEDSIKFPTPQDYSDFKHELAGSVAKLTTHKWRACCVAAPGKIDHELGVVKAFGNLPWKNVPIKDDVSKIVKSDALLENDTKLAGLSEARLLDPPRRKVLYLTVSTGIGSALIVNDRIDPSLQDSEAGHMLFEREGQMVPWESFASGKAIVRRFGKRASEIDDPAIWDVVSRDIALGLIDVIANTQPDTVIIGGGVGSHFHKFEKPLMRELKKYESPMVPIPPVSGAKRPEEAVIYGCYEFMRDHGQLAE